MKRNLFKMLFALLAITLVFCVPSPVYAVEVPEVDYTVEVIPNEVIEATLPDYLREALNDDDDGIITYGTSKPSSNNVHNLTTDGRYSFYLESRLDTTIYSNKVFTGHNGRIKFHLVDTSTDSGGYTVKVFKKGIFDTEVYTYNCQGDEITEFYAGFADDNYKVYFAIIPDGTTIITSSSYIETFNISDLIP